MIVHDNGPEFTSNEILEWACERHLKLCPIQPGACALAALRARHPGELAADPEAWERGYPHLFD